jgi:hypothetical protein
MADSVIKTFEKWLEDGESWIGVFECHALDSEFVGQRIAFCFDSKQWERAVIGKTRAPDNRRTGPGWKFILVAKCETVEDAVRALGKNLDEHRLM